MGFSSAGFGKIEKPNATDGGEEPFVTRRVAKISHATGWSKGKQSLGSAVSDCETARSGNKYRSGRLVWQDAPIPLLGFTDEQPLGSDR